MQSTDTPSRPSPGMRPSPTLDAALGDTRRIMDRVAVSALALGHADGVYVEEVDLPGEEVEVVAAAGAGTPRVGTRVPLPGSLAGEALEEGAPQWVDDVAMERRPIGRLLAEACGRCAALVVPMMSEGEAVGALILLRGPGRPPFTDGEAQAVRLLADMAATALARAAEERRFRALYEDNPALFFTLDRGGRVVDVNRVGAEALGYRPEELRGEPVEVVVWEEDRPRFRTHFAASLDEPDRVHRLEFRKRHRSGTPVWVRESLRSVRGTRGERQVLTVCEDISDRVAVERALRKDRALLRAQSEALQDGILVVSPEGRLLSYNGSFLRIWGFPPEVVEDGVDEGALAWAAEQTVDPAAFRARVAELYAAPDRVSRDEVRLRDGRVLDRYGGPVRGADGEYHGYLWSFRDISTRKRGEEAQQFLAEAGRVLASSLDLTTTLQSVAELSVPRLADWCVVDLCQEDRIERVAVVHADPTKADLAAEYQRCYPPSPQGGETTSGVIQTGEPVLLPEIPDEVLTAVARDERHLAMLREMGFASGIVVPLRIDDRVLGAITLIAAESGRRFGPHELRLAEMLAEWAALAVDKARAYTLVQEASRTRDEVLSVVSHDLRNPIGTIMTSASFIPDLAPDLPEPVLRQLGIIRRQAEAANRLIQDLLDVSRIEGGRLPIDPTPSSPRTLLSEAVETLRPLASPRGLRLACDVGDELPSVCADRDRLLQAFGNLVGNAVRYTPEGGTITLRAEAGEGEVCFSVADSGEGIRPEDLPHLFDRFFQARQKRRGGAGLGLAIVKGIVESHGGRIWVRSKVGEGTVFTFTVPTVGPAAPSRG